MIKLSEIPTRPPESLDREKIEKQTKDLIDDLGHLQELLYAEKKHSLLVVFQGMDASGKDGAVRKVFEECHPLGLQVYSFKRPTEEEFAHDFLWRVHKQAPPKGKIGILNCSHYEDVVIQRVHRWIDEKRVDQRITSINAFEHLLTYDANTVIIKFYLHISKEQQEKELRERLHEKDKHWKHNDNDWRERDHWEEYLRCYEDVINRSEIPWTIIPVDERWYRDYLVAQKLVDVLKGLNMKYPDLPEDTLMR